MHEFRNPPKATQRRFEKEKKAKKRDGMTKKKEKKEKNVGIVK